MIIYTDKSTESIDNCIVLVTSKNLAGIKDAVLSEICRSLPSYNINGVKHSATDSTTVIHTHIQNIFYLDTKDEDVLQRDISVLIRILKRLFCNQAIIIPYKFNIELSDALWKNVVIPSLIKAYINHKPVIYIQTDRDSSVLFKQDDYEDNDCLY